jgi:hypothetical protein
LPKLPDKNSLSDPGSFRSGRAVISAGQVDASAIGRGLEAAGRGIGQVGDTLYAKQEKEKNQQDALDLIRADAMQSNALYEAERQFDQDGDHASHESRFVPLAQGVNREAASIIRDPQKREMWQLKAQNDILQGRSRLAKRAETYGRQERIVQLESTLDGYKNSFTDPKASHEDRARIIDQTRNSIELAKRSGIIDPASAAKLEESYVRGAVKDEAERRLLDDPEGLRRELLGKDAPLPLDDMANPETRAKPMPGQPAPAGPGSGQTFDRGPGREEAGRFIINGIDIKDRVDPNAQYGRSATARAEPFQGIVIHHTGGDGADKFIKYGQSVDRERGGSFGYHFYIDKDGTISQGAPMDARTNHVKPPTARERRDRTGLANENAIGISLLGSGGDETPAQLAAVKELAGALSSTYGIDKGRIVGHGDLQHDRESREGQAALKAIRGELRTADLGLPAPQGRYSALTPLERAEFVKKSETAMRTRLEGQREQLKQQLDDDVESIRRSGQGSEVDLDTAKRVLEPNQVNRYFLNRQEAELEHRATSDLYALPEAALQNRLSDDRAAGGVRPLPGQAGFEMYAKVYDKAEKKANDLRTLRETDPAKAVDEFPEVKTAAEAVEAAPDDPEALQTMVRARLDAQGKVGVADGLRTPITKAEAKILAAPLRGIEGTMLEKTASDWYEGLQQRYGPYGRAVAEASIEYALTRDKDLANAVTGQIAAVTNGERVPAASIRRTEYLLEANRAMAAYGGDFVAEPHRQYGVSQPRVTGAPGPDDATPGQAYLGNTNPNQVFLDKDGNANIDGRHIPKAAIDLLQSNPGLAEEFERKYGSGIAAPILLIRGNDG